MSRQFPLSASGFSPFREMVEVNFTVIESGHSQCVLDVSAKLLNPAGTLHAAAAFTMVDSGMGAALFPLLAEDEGCATVEIQVLYFKPVTSGRLVCDTRLINRSKRLATLESQIESEGRPVVRATGTWSIHKLRKSGT